MFSEKDLESFQSKLPQQHVSVENPENPDEKFCYAEKGIVFQNESELGRDGFSSKPSKMGNLGSQELTLNYLCDNNSKPCFPEKDYPEKVSMNANHFKGKEIICDDLNQENSWVVRDFLQLNEIRGSSSKREVEEEVEINYREKKPRVGTLDLSLALPDVSLSLTASNALQIADPHAVAVLKPSRSIQSLARSNNNTQTTGSNDFTSASYSYSHPISHNPSCSLNRNSNDNYEYSVGRETDQIWNCGEGTNGSVHSRFKPIGDGVSLSNHGGGVFALMQGNRPNHKDTSNSLYRAASSDNLSFPSELPARIDVQSGDSRGRASEHLRGLESSNGGRAHKLSQPERILREIVAESIPVMAQLIQELPDETIELTKEYLKNLIGIPEKRDELEGLQNRLDRRSDLSKETLLKASRNQLDILVSVKMGLANFLSRKNHLPTIELVEIFMLERCRNVNCKSLLPVEDCDCKICSANKGFCSSCMCPVCLNFDCANNTCSWVGCDVCSHWCHADCGIQRDLIKPDLGLKGTSGTTGVQFHCLGCGHASEMFGFVKDVFVCCAKDWGLPTLIKEVDCVRKIFRGSEDSRGKELQMIAEAMLTKLESKLMSTSDACSIIIQFFNYTDGISEFPALGVSSKDLMAPQSSHRIEAPSRLPPNSLPSKFNIYNLSSSSLQRELLPCDVHHQNDLKPSLTSNPRTELKKDEFDSLQAIVRMKEAEAMLFQSRADEARKEAEGYRRIVRAKTKKLDEEYDDKISKLCLQETEERRRKKREELKQCEESYCDYYNTKMRMDVEVGGLLKRLEATKQQLV